MHASDYEAIKGLARDERRPVIEQLSIVVEAGMAALGHESRLEAARAPSAVEGQLSISDAVGGD